MQNAEKSIGKKAGTKVIKAKAGNNTMELVSFFEGYMSAYDNGFRAYGDVLGLAYTWVGWLEYNIQRALGTCVGEAERTLGITEVRNTINRIKYIYGAEEEIKAALETCLPRV